MDINQFDWVMVKQRPGFWKGTLQHGIILFPLLIGGSFLVVNFAYSGQQIFKREELLIVLEIVLLVSVGIINMIWHSIAKALPEKLIHYKVSAEGISKEKRKIGLTALKNSTVEETLTKNALPYQQWRKATEAPFVELTLPTNQGKITMAFPGEYERQKFIRTLQEYLHPTPITELKN